MEFGYGHKSHRKQLLASPLGGIQTPPWIGGTHRRSQSPLDDADVNNNHSAWSLIALVFAYQLRSLSLAQAVYSDSVGFGRMFVWMFAAFMFPLTAVLFLLMASIIKIRSRNK